MFNIGAGELIFILMAALLVLGPKRLPELARGLGRFVREFRRQTDEVRTVVTREFYRMDLDEPPARPPARPPAEAPPAPGAAALPADEQPPLPEPAHPEPAASAFAHRAPAPLDPSVARTQELAPVSPAETQAAVAAGADVDGAGADEAALPRLEPVPGTVARRPSGGGARS